MSDKDEVVSLKFNTQALTESLRHAFAHELSAVLELVQNGRRAGADTIWISTANEGEQPCLTVSDNGGGIENFQVLLDVATSGWDESIAREERPYGLGFLAALYSAPAVQVISRGRMLSMDTAAALSSQSFTVQRSEVEMPAGVTTMIKLVGFNSQKLLHQCQHLFSGYLIRVIVDGTEMARPHALDTPGFIATELGMLRTASINQVALGRPRSATVYLQGFCVLKPPYAYSIEHMDVVHLDSTKWFGKFPDRNTVVNENQMREAVNAVIAGRYREALLTARRNLPEEEFVLKYYHLAADLGMLDVFNNINVIPCDWLSQFNELPYGCRSELQFLGRYDGKPFIRRVEVESGSVVLARLSEQIDPDSDESAVARRWVHAYARGALLLDRPLHYDHWVYAHLQIDDDTEVYYRVVGVVKSGKADSRRLNRLWNDPSIVICSGIETVDQDGAVGTLTEPVAEDEENVIYVPLDGEKADASGTSSSTSPRASAQYVQGTVLRLMADYFDEDALNSADLDFDEASINEMVRELLADTPEERLAMALTTAIASYSSIRKLRCEIEVGPGGDVTVRKLRALG